MQMTFSPIDIAPDNVSHSHGLGKLNDTYAKLGLLIVVKCLIKPNITPPPKKMENQNALYYLFLTSIKPMF